MARTTQRRQSQRWPAAETEDRWAAEESDGRWAEEDDPDAGWQEPAPSRRRQGRLRLEVPPIVNPYAMVSLAAALVGLFPVAIVFGFISYSHPRGRVMALFGLLIGFAELVVAAGAVLIVGNFLPEVPRPDFLASSTSTSAATTAQASPTQPTVPPDPPAPNAGTGSAPTPEPAVVRKGSACTDAGQIGVAAEGGDLICLATSGGAHRWGGPYTVSSTLAEPGTTCEGGAAKTARTADGRALVCESAARTWVLWTE
ncbi:DUF4190 domain-containing protein [Nocardia callitridis]